MTHRFRCLACKGEYFDQQLDGAPYAHVCPPLRGDKKKPEQLRDDHRDENVKLDGRRRTIGIRSEGAGVKCLSDEKLAEPRWISALKMRIAKEDDDDDA